MGLPTPGWCAALRGSRGSLSSPLQPRCSQPLQPTCVAPIMGAAACSPVGCLSVPTVPPLSCRTPDGGDHDRGGRRSPGSQAVLAELRAPHLWCMPPLKPRKEDGVRHGDPLHSAQQKLSHVRSS